MRRHANRELFEPLTRGVAREVPVGLNRRTVNDGALLYCGHPLGACLFSKIAGVANQKKFRRGGSHEGGSGAGDSVYRYISHRDSRCFTELRESGEARRGESSSATCRSRERSRYSFADGTPG